MTAEIEALRDDPEYRATIDAIAKKHGVDADALVDDAIQYASDLADRSPDPKPEPTGPVSPQLKKFRELLK